MKTEKPLYVPRDLPAMLEKYHEEGSGPCGPACLAVIRQETIGRTLGDWKAIFGEEYRGWAKWSELRQFAQHTGRQVTLKKVCGGLVPRTPDKYLICRVQWVGPNPDKPEFACWRHWTEAAAHTHFILIDGDMVFCSEDGWFPYDKLHDYLEGHPTKVSGVITSYMEISR